MNQPGMTVSVQSRIRQIRQYLAKKPGDGRAWLVLAELLSNEPAGAGLQRAVEQAIRLNPDNHQAWMLAARMQRRTHGRGKVQAWLEQMARENPTLAAPSLAAATFMSGSNPEAAVRSFEKILSAFPADTRSHLLLAELELGQGRANRAASLLDQALGLDPGRARAWALLGVAHLKSGRQEAGQAAFDRAIDLGARDPEPFEIRAEARKELGDWTGALSDFREAARRTPPGPELLCRIGTCLARLHRYDEAGAHFNRALELDPGDAMAKINLGLLCAARGKRETAVERLEKVLADADLDTPVRRPTELTVAVLREQGRLETHIEEALNTDRVSGLQTALDQAPESLLAVDRVITGRLDSLAQRCRQLEFEPDSLQPHPDTRHSPVLEACTQARVAADSKTLDECRKRLSQGMPTPAGGGKHRSVTNILQAIRDRRSHHANLLDQGEGEAWLRYWHARLLRGSPECGPGQYKAIRNTIGADRPPPPQCVTGAMRHMLSELRPTVPTGPARALFMHAAIAMIHGFGDGNGRLARFMQNWELESAGYSAVFFPGELHAELNETLWSMLGTGDPTPLASLLVRAHDHCGRLLAELNGSDAAQ